MPAVFLFTADLRVVQIGIHEVQYIHCHAVGFPRGAIRIDFRCGEVAFDGVFPVATFPVDVAQQQVCRIVVWIGLQMYFE